MIPPYFYRQYAGQHLNYNPEKMFRSYNGIIYELMDTQLKVIYLSGQVEFINYSDIKSVRLDYDYNHIYGHNIGQPKKQYYCELNGRYEIRSKNIDTILAWEESGDFAYITFISRLHLRFLLTSFAPRTYQTNLLPRDFTILSIGAAILWLFCTVIIGYFSLSLNSYLPLVISVVQLIVFSIYVLNKKPKKYNPAAIPPRFLPLGSSS